MIAVDVQPLNRLERRTFPRRTAAGLIGDEVKITIENGYRHVFERGDAELSEPQCESAQLGDFAPDRLDLWVFRAGVVEARGVLDDIDESEYIKLAGMSVFLCSGAFRLSSTG